MQLDIEETVFTLPLFSSRNLEFAIFRWLGMVHMESSGYSCGEVQNGYNSIATHKSMSSKEYVVPAVIFGDFFAPVQE